MWLISLHIGRAPCEHEGHVYQSKREAWNRSFPHHIQKEPILQYLNFRFPVPRTVKWCFCFKFVALCYSSPGELIQPCSQKSVLWGGDLSLRRCVLHPPFPPPCGWNVSPMGWAGRATWDREWKLNMGREMSHPGRSRWQPRGPGTAESRVTWKLTPTLFMPLSFGVPISSCST